MIAKLIVWDETRERALARMLQALAQYRVVGVANNVDFLSRLVACPAFAQADLDTGLIEREHDFLFADAAEPPREAWLAAALAELLRERAAAAQSAAGRRRPVLALAQPRRLAPEQHGTTRPHIPLRRRSRRACRLPTPAASSCSDSMASRRRASGQMLPGGELRADLGGIAQQHHRRRRGRETPRLPARPLPRAGRRRSALALARCRRRRGRPDGADARQGDRAGRQARREDRQGRAASRSSKP